MDLLTSLEIAVRNAAALLDLAHHHPVDNYAAIQGGRYARNLDERLRLLWADGMGPDFSRFIQGSEKPRPVLGIVRPSWHHLASSVSATIHAEIMHAAECDIANTSTHWAAVRERLLGFEPFDADEIISGMERERELERRQVEEAAKVEWSKPDSPRRWGLRFNVSERTFKRRCKDGKIRHKKLSDRSYMIHLGDLPSDGQ